MSTREEREERLPYGWSRLPERGVFGRADKRERKSRIGGNEENELCDRAQDVRSDFVLLLPRGWFPRARPVVLSGERERGRFL
jgi:hypothetical protein